jgi:cellulose synthase/poly-beta-1,6-N-acetylglucosamine synthase-like glycosyltransferase
MDARDANIVFQNRPAAPTRFAVGIPARDEEDRLRGCLLAMGRQTGVDMAEVGVVIGLNNTTDRSLEVCIDAAQSIDCGLTILNSTLEPGRAHAGWARKLALDEACRQCAAGGFLLTTDADTIVDDDWIFQNLAAFDAGADGVAGFVTADPAELQRLPDAILDRGALEWEYQNLLAEYEAAIDPVPWDPAPRHNQACGASLAVRRDAYAAVGGLPPLPVGEDRALVDALAARDYRIRHSRDAHVTTSARTVGRASGGMSDALRLRHDPEYPCDDILETVSAATFRWRLRRQLREDWGAWPVSAIAARLDVPETAVAAAAGEPYFGAAFTRLQQSSPRLSMELVTLATLPAELGKLRALCSTDGFPTHH